jgi:hypothetical protein
VWIEAKILLTSLCRMSSPFLHPDNKGILQRVLYKDVCRRYGGDLNEKQATRLIKTVDYYVTEVHRVHGNKNMQFLNKEVLEAVLPDYMAYLERNERSVTRSAVSDIEEGPAQKQDVGARREIQDIDNAFSALQTQRQEKTAVRQTIQDFQISLSDEAPLSMELFERMKREREESALVVAPPTANPFVEASDSFSQGSKKAREDAEAMFADQERKKLERRAAIALPVPPDMRAIYERPAPTSQENAAAGNPTLAERPRETLANLPQAIITREPDKMSYRETETNLFLYSGDRDWISNTTETRYNFSTVFDPAGLPGSTPFYQNPSVPTRFRNIVRIEFIKAIIPGEGLDPLVRKSTGTAYTPNANMNALSFPYIQVRVPELDTNSYGTNQGITSSFALIQYDANWINDSSLGDQRGYLAMIPKFMKCQKVFTTPLSTLQRLSIRLQRPDGTLLSSSLDTLDVQNVFPSIAVNSGVFGAGGVSGTVYLRDPAVDVAGSAYYWVKTKNYFSVASFNAGDRVLLKNIAWSSWTPLSPSGNQLNQLTSIVDFLERASGHVIVSVGMVTGSGTSSVFSDTPVQGYVNAFLVRGDFPDPNASATLGVFTPIAPAGIADDATASSGSAANYLINNPVTSGRVLNQSRQVHVAFRVITREFDSTGVLRTDNL